MKCFRLQYTIQMIEVKNFADEHLAGENENPAPHPLSLRAEDPVAKSERLLNRAEEMLKQGYYPPPPPPIKRRISPSRVMVTRVYDVPAESLEEAVAKLKKFEEAAASIGMPFDGDCTDFTSGPVYGLVT